MVGVRVVTRVTASRCSACNSDVRGSSSGVVITLRRGRSVADLLRGEYKRSEYGKVILHLAVLRRPSMPRLPR